MSRLLQYFFNSIFPPFFIISAFFFRYHFFDHYVSLIQEDGVVEWGQFGLLVMVGGLLVRQGMGAKGWQALTRYLLVASGVVILLVAGEEISWGQRLFSLQNPEYFAENNLQGELTLHNLDTLQSWLPAGYMAVSLLLVLGSPILLVLLRVKKWGKQIRLLLTDFYRLAPPWYLAAYFLPVGLFYAVFVFWQPFGAVMRNGVLLFIGRDQEVYELVLLLGLAIHAFSLWQKSAVYSKKFR
jgi:hypothetical protein